MYCLSRSHHQRQGIPGFSQAVWSPCCAGGACREVCVSHAGCDGWRSRVEHPDTPGRHAGPVLQPPGLAPPLGLSRFHLPRPQVGDVCCHPGPSSQMAALSLPAALVCEPHRTCSLPAPTQRPEVFRHLCLQPSPPLHGQRCRRAREGPAAQHPGARARLTDYVVLCTLPSPPGHTSRLKPPVLDVLKRSIKICGSDILINEPNHFLSVGH